VAPVSVRGLFLRVAQATTTLAATSLVRAHPGRRVAGGRCGRRRDPGLYLRIKSWLPFTGHPAPAAVPGPRPRSWSTDHGPWIATVVRVAVHPAHHDGHADPGGPGPAGRDDSAGRRRRQARPLSEPGIMGARSAEGLGPAAGPHPRSHPSSSGALARERTGHAPAEQGSALFPEDSAAQGVQSGDLLMCPLGGPASHPAPTVSGMASAWWSAGRCHRGAAPAPAVHCSRSPG
jgi:hypothetical protein